MIVFYYNSDKGLTPETSVFSALPYSVVYQFTNDYITAVSLETPTQPTLVTALVYILYFIIGSFLLGHKLSVLRYHKQLEYTSVLIYDAFGATDNKRKKKKKYQLQLIFFSSSFLHISIMLGSLYLIHKM